MSSGLKTVISGATSLIPGVGAIQTALKVGPWVVIALLGGLLVIDHYRITAANADVAVQTGKIAQAVQQCQTEAATQAAAESAQAAQQIAAATQAANAAETALATERQTAAQQKAQADATLAATIANIQKEAAEPGQDGALTAPVLSGMFAP